MALVPCTECDRQISELAISCPGCGAPTGVKEQISLENKPSKAYVLTPDGKKRFIKATTFDIIISIFLPFWGVVVGIIALCKGETKRGFTMLAIVACVTLLIIFYASNQPH
jgi:hypothetical protein